MRFLKHISPYIIPFTILLSTIILFSMRDSISEQWLTMLPFMVYVLFVLTLLLAWWFNRSTVFFLVLMLIICVWMVSKPEIIGKSDPFFYQVVYHYLSLLVPFNIFIFSRLKERGIFTFWGKWRLIFLLLQLVVIVSIGWSDNPAYLIWLIGDQPDALTGERQSLSIASICIYLVISILYIIRYEIKKMVMDCYWLGYLCATFLAMYFLEVERAVFLFSAGAAFILLAAILHSSYSMAYLDELTGAPSRRLLKVELMKLSGTYAIAMLDIDYFKKFNDRYGHDIGDEVLRLVANCLKKVRGGGKAFRYGGEEFTILFPTKSVEEALPYLEEIRETVANTSYQYTTQNQSRSKKLSVTISIGVAERNEKHKTPQDVLVAADKALYRAKKKGRNCVSK